MYKIQITLRKGKATLSITKLDTCSLSFNNYVGIQQARNSTSRTSALTCASATGDSTLPSPLAVAVDAVTGGCVCGGLQGASALHCRGGLVERVATSSSRVDAGEGDGSLEVLGGVVVVSGAG